MQTAPPSATESPNRLEWFAGISITLVIAALHIVFLFHRGGLWRDEVHQLTLARLETLDYLRHDSFPALAAFVIHGWTLVVSRTDAALRGLGLLTGLCVVGVLWLTTWRIARKPPLFSLALFALNPFVISYGDSLRGYGLGSLLILGFTAMIWMWLQKSSAPRLLALAVLAALSVQALYQNTVLVAAVCAGAAAVCARQRLWRRLAGLFAAGLFAALTLLPYVGNISASSGAAGGAKSPWKLSRVFVPLQSALDFPLPQFHLVWLVLTLAVLTLMIFSLRQRRTADGAAGAGDLPLFAGTTIAVALAGYVWFLSRASVQTRAWHFIPLLALTSVCFDLGLAGVARIGRVAAMGLAAALTLMATPFSYRQLQTRLTNVDWVAGKLSAEAKPGDYILITPWYCGITFDHYFQGRAAWDTIPPVNDHSANRTDLAVEQMKKPRAIAPVLEKVSATLRRGGSVWIVGDTEIPEVATPAPADLPPPPLQWTGWMDTPYNVIWDAQIAHFIRDHAHRFEPAATGLQQPVSDLENLPLRVAEGWRDDIISPPPTVLPIK